MFNATYLRYLGYCDRLFIRNDRQRLERGDGKPSGRLRLQISAYVLAVLGTCRYLIAPGDLPDLQTGVSRVELLNQLRASGLQLGGIMSLQYCSELLEPDRLLGYEDQRFDYWFQLVSGHKIKMTISTGRFYREDSPPECFWLSHRASEPRVAASGQAGSLPYIATSSRATRMISPNCSLCVNRRTSSFTNSRIPRKISTISRLDRAASNRTVARTWPAPAIIALISAIFSAMVISSRAISNCASSFFRFSTSRKSSKS